MLNIISKIFQSDNERSHKIKKNILNSFIFRFLNIAINLLLVPLTINYLNTTQYGIWLALHSIISWFTFFDIGLCNGFRNKFADALARLNFNKAKIYLSRTYILLSIIMALYYLMFLLINPYINYTKLFNSQVLLSSELKSLALITISFFALRFIFRLI